MEEQKMATNREMKAFVRLIRELEESLNNHNKFQQIMTDIEEILEPTKKGDTEAAKPTGEAQST